MNVEAQVLKKMIEFQHNLTIWYLSLLKETDVTKCFEFEDKKINNLYWVVAHLAHSEDFLLSVALGKAGHNYAWLKRYEIGGSQDISPKVSYKELIEVSKEIHQKCMKNLDEMTDEELNKDNMLGLNFAGDFSKRAIIMHQIRHEGIHAGHLSLLCKLNNIKTV